MEMRKLLTFSCQREEEEEEEKSGTTERQTGIKKQEETDTRLALDLTLLVKKHSELEFFANRVSCRTHLGKQTQPP